MEFDEIRYSLGKYYLTSNNTGYIFEELKDNIDIKIIEETQQYDIFHNIIINIYGGIVTNYENNNYVLLEIKDRDFRKIELNDIEKIASLPVINNLPYTDWSILWSRKIDNFEKFIMNKEVVFDFREYYDYFIGLGENAIVYYQYAKSKNLKLGFTYNRIDNNYSLVDLHNPLKITISPVVKGLAEYVKYSFFNDNPIDIEKVENLKLSYDDSIAFFSRLLFPTYFFDAYKSGKEDTARIKKIIELSSSYENYLKIIFRALKKRYSNIPQIKWLLINQF